MVPSLWSQKQTSRSQSKFDELINTQTRVKKSQRKKGVEKRTDWMSKLESSSKTKSKRQKKNRNKRGWFQNQDCCLLLVLMEKEKVDKMLGLRMVRDDEKKNIEEKSVWNDENNWTARTKKKKHYLLLIDFFFLLFFPFFSCWKFPTSMS